MSRVVLGVDFDVLKLEGAIFIGEIDKEPLPQIKKLHIVSGLNSVQVIELTYRLEFHDVRAVDDEIGPNVADILILVVDRDDALGLIIDPRLAKGDFECAMIYRFGIARAEGGPDILGDIFEKLVHYECNASWV